MILLITCFVILAYFRKQSSRNYEKDFSENFRANTKAKFFAAESLVSHLTITLCKKGDNFKGI